MFDLKVLKENSMVQSMPVVIIKFDWVLLILKRKKKTAPTTSHEESSKLMRLFE